MLCKVTHCARCALANIRPHNHNLCWVDQEMGTAISHNQVAGLMLKDVCQTLVSFCETSFSLDDQSRHLLLIYQCAYISMYISYYEP